MKPLPVIFGLEFGRLFKEVTMRLTLTFLLIFILQGCAARKMAVSNADSLISYQVNKRLPLYSKQKDQLDQDIDKFLNKSKDEVQDLLPLIDEIKFNDPKKLSSQYQILEGFYKKTAHNFSEVMSKYIAKLDPKQQKDFFNTLDDENREILKKEKNKEEQIDQIEERFKLFFGSIKGKQKQLVREYADYFGERSKGRLTRRVSLHNAMKATLNKDMSESSKATEILESFDEYQEKVLAGNKNLEMLQKILPTIDDSQASYFRKEAQEIKALIRHYLSVDY